MTTSDIRNEILALKAKLPINQDALDNECRRQSWLVEEAGELEVKVLAKFKIQKDRLNRVRSELYLDIRDEPESFGVGKKPTAPIIDACIEEIGKYRDALTDLRELEDLVDTIKYIKAVIDTRRSMLHELVKLFVYNYMSGPQDSTLLRDSQSKEALAVDKENRIIALRQKNAAKKKQKGSSRKVQEAE